MIRWMSLIKLKRVSRAALLLGACVGLSGCSWLTFGLLGDDEPKQLKAKGPELGRVVQRLPELQLAQVAPIKPTRAEVMAAYNRVYGMLPSTLENHAVGKRLADLHMAEGEDRDIEGLAAPYQPAIDLYESLLAKRQAVTQDETDVVDDAAEDDAAGIDEILYQLARAHDLLGESERTLHYLNRLVAEYPGSEYIPEGRFRRAEIKFSADDYRAATADYGYVVGLGNTTPYYRNASYMLGWSEFKRSRFDEGLEQFFNVVDVMLATQEQSQLSSMDDELLEDTFRVVTLALAYLDGAQTLAEEMRKRGKPHWQYLAYQRLADDYFDKDRYLDNVATWQTFIEHNSLDIRAPAAHQGMIQTLMDAGFPSDVIPKKKEFIVRYGVYSEFWSHHPADVRESYLPTLHEYLSEMAKLAHAEAQESQQAKSYLAAAQWYEEIIVTFPEDPRTAEYLFLLGESYTEADEPARAVAAYQRVMREFPDYPQAHEAGYAAILGLSEMINRATAADLELWQRLKIDAQIEFALIFPGDPRAPAVQTDAADTLFGLGHTREALQLAENLLAEWPDVEPGLKQTALLIIGHGRFELDEFVAAEQAYHNLKQMDLNEDEWAKVHERLLAAVYKQGEAAEAADAADDAVYHFMRIASLDPSAPLAAQGHFDAIAVVEGAGRIAEAADMLATFRTTYPGHELGEGIDMRLASMYEQTENWSAAAVEYLGLSKTADDLEVRRQSKYRTAEIYLQQDDVAAAIEHFRDYAHTYKQPWDLRLEAMHHMDELYQRTGEADNRRFWLQQKIDLHRQLGSQASERATYLAAGAQMVFATDERERFAGIRLSHPLKRSLKKKQRALKKTLRAFEDVAQYEVAQYTTAATFEIADLYSVLSKSIMASDRPQNLSELELEQYNILLEEQSFPFEEQSIGLHEINMQRAWEGTYDEWVRKSYAELKRLMPGRFNKPESEVAYAEAIH